MRGTDSAQRRRVAFGAKSELDCSVVICAHTEERWDDTLRAVRSALEQRPAPREVIVVVDHNPELQQRLCERLTDVHVVPNHYERGISGARNAGVAAATGDIVAFLDDDAIAQVGWLSALAEPYSDPNVIGVGGHTVPDWATGRPRWFPSEFDWVIGCTYTGREPGIVRNLLGGNASYRRNTFAFGGFASHIGRSSRHPRPLGCEDTEFCIRAGNALRHGVFVFEDRAVIVHHVPAPRETFSYFRSRCFAEGLSKAHVTNSVGYSSGLASERRYVAVTLPLGLSRDLGKAVRGDWPALLRASAMIVGLTCTAWGYSVALAVGTCRRRFGGS